MSVVSEATSQAISAGASPLVLSLAQKMLGQKAYIGYCQSFVERVTGSGFKGTSAINAWNNAQNRVQGSQGLQPGDLVYFSANQGNGNNGHTGIYQGNGQFISATNSGILNNDINKWQTSTGQKLLGYIPQGNRQAQQNTQMQQNPVQQTRAIQRPQPLIMPLSSSFPMQQPTQTPQLPNPFTPASQEDTTTYGNITVPNL